MYRNELLPDCIAVGMTASEFWDSYPCEITPYFKAREKQRRMKDEEDFTLYLYFTNAIEVALHNAFRGKGKKPLEHIKEPLMKTYEDEHRELTEEEKQAQVALLFANLGQMQANFEKSKAAAE